MDSYRGCRRCAPTPPATNWQSFGLQASESAPFRRSYCEALLGEPVRLGGAPRTLAFAQGLRSEHALRFQIGLIRLLGGRLAAELELGAGREVLDVVGDVPGTGQQLPVIDA